MSLNKPRSSKSEVPAGTKSGPNVSSKSSRLDAIKFIVVSGVLGAIGGTGYKYMNSPQDQREESKPLFFGALTGVVSALAAGAYRVMNDDERNKKNKSGPKQTQSQKKRPDHEVKIDENESDDHEPQRTEILPEITSKSRKVKIDKPHGLDMSDEEFELASKKLGHKVENELLPKLETTANTPQRNVQFLLDIMSLILEMPEFKDYAERTFPRNFDYDSFNQVAAQVERFFPNGGNILRIFATEISHQKMDVAVSYYKIIKGREVNVKHGQDSVNVPIVVCEEKFSNDPEGEFGLYLPEMDLGLVNLGRIQTYIKAVIARMRELNLVSPDLTDQQLSEILEREHVEGAINHEATHIMIGKTKPRGKDIDRELKYDVNLQVPTNGLGTLNRNGKYNAIQFQEMAAVGVEIANSNSDIPLNVWHHLNNQAGALSPDHPYYLVARTLPGVCISELPDGPSKTNILELLNSGSLDSQVLFAAVGEHACKSYYEKVGEKMAKIGFDFFKKRK